MNAVTIRPEEHTYLEVDAIGDRVALEVYVDHHYSVVGLSVDDAVALSRALVKAASEVAGVAVSETASQRP